MDNLELGKDKTIRKGIFFYVLLLAAIIVGTILFTPEVIQILGGKKYVASVVLLPGLVFGTFVQAITTIFTIILTYDKSVVKTAFVTGLFALVSIAAKVFLLPDYGLLVLVYVNIAVVLSLFFINYVLVKRAGYANAIFLKGIVAVIILIGFLVALSPLLYQQQSLRYVVIGIFLAGCIIMVGLNRSRIKDIVGRMRRKRTVKNH
jgi:O-antigen/teichoic acid export membrane protein